MIQLFYAVLAGLLTVGAPCILPVLPIILGSTIGQRSKLRPLAITLGFILSFALAAFLLSRLVASLMIAPDTLRSVAVVFLGIFGIFLIWPKPFEKITGYFSQTLTFASGVASSSGQGAFGGFVLGLVLGILWTPCAGPVLGSILTLIAASEELDRAVALLVAYAIGAGIPLLIIGYANQWATTRISSIAKYSGFLQRTFGILIVILAVAMFFQWDVAVQAELLKYYPENFFKY